MKELKKIRSAMMAAAIVCLSSYASADIIYQFDGSRGYDADSTASTGGNWVDFNNRTTGDGLGIASGGTETVLAGTSNSNDPQIRSDFNPGIDAGLVTGFQLRLRSDVDQNSVFDDTLSAANFSLFYGLASYTSPGAGNAGGTNANPDSLSARVVTAQTDGWTVVDWDFAAGTLAGTIQSLRIDPTNLATGNGDAFEIDYLTVKAVAVPEPSSFALVAIVGLAATLQRRRSTRAKA